MFKILLNGQTKQMKNRAERIIIEQFLMKKHLKQFSNKKLFDNDALRPVLHLLRLPI
jgi:hypothetical protein